MPDGQPLEGTFPTIPSPKSVDPPRNLATLAPHVEGEGQAICNIPGGGEKRWENWGSCPTQVVGTTGTQLCTCRLSHLFPSTLHSKEAPVREAGEGGTSHVKREKPDCTGLKFSLCIRSQGHGESSLHKDQEITEPGAFQCESERQPLFLSRGWFPATLPCPSLSPPSLLPPPHTSPPREGVTLGRKMGRKLLGELCLLTGRLGHQALALFYLNMAFLGSSLDARPGLCLCPQAWWTAFVDKLFHPRGTNFPRARGQSLWRGGSLGVLKEGGMELGAPSPASPASC